MGTIWYKSKMAANDTETNGILDIKLFNHMDSSPM